MIVDLFAGCGGADLGMRDLGLEPVGFEIDKRACETRAAAGMRTIRTNLRDFPVPARTAVEGIWSSPPCKDYSQAGKKLGRDGPTGDLVDITPKWVDILRPRWVACENVPLIKKIWEDHERFYQSLGYKTWIGVVNCADLGLPQTRKRAILLACLDRSPGPPVLTHSKNPGSGLFGDLLPWVSMAEALGWKDEPEVVTRNNRRPTGGNEFPSTRPSWALTEKTRSWELNRRADYKDGKPGVPNITSDKPAPTLTGPAGAKQQWVFERPSNTIVGTFRPDVVAGPGYRGGRASYEKGIGENVPRQNSEGAVRIEIEEALILQGFPSDFPLQGPRTSRFLQVGNAVPPVLAKSVLQNLID